MTFSVFDLTDKTLDALITGLDIKHTGKEGVSETLIRLAAQNRTHRSEPMASANSDPACRHLETGLALTKQVDKKLCAAITDLAPLLHWKWIGKHVPKPPTGLMTDYAFCQIIGPSGIYPGNDFMMGLFIIGPRQYYPEHQHTAPELYWLFSGPTQWRFRVDGDWIHKEAGELQWNKPHAIHGICTTDVPLFALWAWTNDIDGDFEILGSGGKAKFNEPD